MSVLYERQYVMSVLYERQYEFWVSYDLRGSTVLVLSRLT